MESNERYRLTKHRVGELKGFYSHLATYGGVIGLLFLIDLLTGGVWWFFWPLFGWGIGVAAHAFNVFGKEVWLGSGWEKKKIEELMDKMDQN